jgi:hypothetical protein
MQHIDAVDRGDRISILNRLGCLDHRHQQRLFPTSSHGYSQCAPRCRRRLELPVQLVDRCLDTR